MNVWTADLSIKANPPVQCRDGRISYIQLSNRYRKIVSRHTSFILISILHLGQATITFVSLLLSRTQDSKAIGKMSISHEYFSCFCFCTLSSQGYTPQLCPRPTHSLTVLPTLCGNCTALSAKQTASTAYGYLRKKREEEARKAVADANAHGRQVSSICKPDNLDPTTGRLYSRPHFKTDKVASLSRRTSSRSEKATAGMRKGVCGPHSLDRTLKLDRVSVARTKLRIARARQAEMAVKIERLDPERQAKVLKTLADGGSCDVCGQDVVDCLASDRMCIA